MRICTFYHLAKLVIWKKSKKEPKDQVTVNLERGVQFTSSKKTKALDLSTFYSPKTKQKHLTPFPSQRSPHVCTPVGLTP